MTEKTFDSQMDGETIVLVIRKHWLSFLPVVFFSIILLAFGIAGLVLPSFMKIEGVSYNFYLIAESLLFLLPALFFYVSWILNLLSYGVLTEERIVDVDQHGLLVSGQTSANLEKIEDVTAEVSGLIPTLLNVGSVRIMTAGEVPNIEYTYVKNPQTVVEAFHKAQEKAAGPKG